MKLTKEQISAVLSKLNEDKDKRRPCSNCGNNEWILSDKIFEVREYQGGGLMVGGESVLMPLVVISCKECGHLRFMNAISMGVVLSEPVENEEK